MGKRDFLMGLWSLASAYRVFTEVGQLYIHSDGTLDAGDEHVIHRLFPSARVADSRMFLQDFGDRLKNFPELLKFRSTYRKFQTRIIDQHFIGDSEIRLFLDSDLLWFREPKELMQAIRNGVPRPLMMSNAEYIRMEFRDGTSTDDRTSRPNGGIVLYQREQMNMDRMEEFLQKSDYLGKRFGDQAWMAWTLRPDLLPEDTYIIKGTLTDTIIVRHYTSPQRLKFYFYGINKIARDILEACVR
ncbi:hypothetical protein KGO06_02835 [Patescibacteria group bacterium]|nr:hypothetical protein [Patescibacteria group bacterium]